MPHAASTKDAIAQRYRRFARHEAHGSSPLYEMLATYVASSAKVLAFLEGLPVDRQQPNLLFAAVRQAVGLPAEGRGLEEAIERQAAPIAAIMKSRTTQTNEPARCAALLPVLARLSQPLAILEVGASAGLCLLLDRYGYDYGRQRIVAPPQTRASAPVFPCHADNLTPLPTELPRIGWCRGLDLNPLSVGSSQQMDWLKALVWPEHSARLARLGAAIEIAPIAAGRGPRRLARRCDGSSKRSSRGHDTRRLSHGRARLCSLPIGSRCLCTSCKESGRHLDQQRGPPRLSGYRCQGSGSTKA